MNSSDPTASGTAVNGSAYTNGNGSIGDGSADTAGSGSLANGYKHANENVSITNGSTCTSGGGSTVNGSTCTYGNGSTVNGSTCTNGDGSTVNGSACTDGNGSTVNGSACTNGDDSLVNGSRHANKDGSTVNGSAHTNGGAKTNDVHSKAISPKLLLLSTADEAGLHRLANVFSQHFASATRTIDTEFLDSLAYTLNTRRSALAWKSYAVIDSLSMLEDLGQAISKPLRAQAAEPKLGFVFTGQGAQWHAMGRELSMHPVFKESLLRSHEHLQSLGCEWLLTGACSPKVITASY
jgi:hypothetical protein